MQNPWDIPPAPAIGDPTPEITYAAVGRALSTWEWFEGHLAVLFTYFLGSRSAALSAIRAYGSVVSFKGRSDMVSAAAEAFFTLHPDPAVAADVKKLLKESSFLASRRNEIAHGIVSPHFNDETESYVLGPAYYSTKKRHITLLPSSPDDYLTAGKYAYSSKEIYDFSLHFHKLYDNTMLIIGSLHSKGRGP